MVLYLGRDPRRPGSSAARRGGPGGRPRGGGARARPQISILAGVRRSGFRQRGNPLSPRRPNDRQNARTRGQALAMAGNAEQGFAPRRSSPFSSKVSQSISGAGVGLPLRPL